MSASTSVPVRDAVILAAGNGDRFKTSHHHSKLLHPVLGQPLILRTLETAAAAGIATLNVVLGYEADRVRATVERHPIPGATVRFAYNPDWHLENGVSALQARQLCNGRRFALLMGDHLFEAPVLRRLASLDARAGDSMLAIDRGDVDPAIADEATKVALEGGSHRRDRQEPRAGGTRSTPVCSSSPRRCSTPSKRPAGAARRPSAPACSAWPRAA